MAHKLTIIESNPTREVDDREAKKIHALLNRGTNHHCWGANAILISDEGELLGEKKATWLYRKETYIAQKISYGHRRRSFTLKHRKRHLSCEITAFFCGASPSEDTRNGYQYLIIDGDRRCDGFTQLDKTIGDFFPGPCEPSTSGTGTHRLVALSFYPDPYHPSPATKYSDRQMHDAVIHLSQRLAAASRLLHDTESFHEIKGACVVWDGEPTMGTLARMPRTLTSKQIEEAPFYTLQEMDELVGKVERQVGINPKSCLQQTPRRVSRDGRSERANTNAHPEERICVVSLEEEHTAYIPENCPDAFQRMLHANASFVRSRKSLPSNEEELCDYYESIGLATGERTSERVSLAGRIISYCLTNWKITTNTLAFSDSIIARASELEQIIPDLSKYNLRRPVSHMDLAAFEYIALSLCSRDGFSSRDKIMEIMNTWKEQGHLSCMANEYKLAAIRKILVGEGVLVVIREHTRPTGTKKGIATTFSKRT